MNFSQTTPPRFRKEFLDALDADGDGFLSREEVREMLGRIGAEKTMTEGEIEDVFKELEGGEEGIDRAKFEEIL